MSLCTVRSQLGEIDGIADGQRQIDREDLLGDMAQGA